MGYQAPLNEMNFLLNKVFRVQETLSSIAAFKDFDSELYTAILDEAAKFAENVLFPLNRSGDEEGCRFVEGKVTTPQGFKQAYQDYCQGGWQGLGGDPEFGGQGLPKTLHLLVEEMLYSANTSFNLYSSLTNGAYHAIRAHASEQLKQTYLPPMLEGRWAGAMGLTEPHAGSDLGLIKTKAQPHDDGAYRISGTKIFITGGDHDLSENIIHLVLAKLPDAPEGPKGISLFLVPKIQVDADGSLGQLNNVSCGSIEHKMGIKASSTCVMNFDDAVGYLVGEPNRGLMAMFTMMNLERLSIAIQGIGLAETSYQQAKAYALDRKQGRDDQGDATAIIAHADIRRMLMEQRVNIEPARALAVYMGLLVDQQYHHNDEAVRKHSADLMAFLTPVAKAFFTDKGYEACNHGMQIFGGHGFIREWGMEQLVRDAKIAQIYEGTNGIQAQDLLVRKVCLDKSGLLQHFYAAIGQTLSKPTATAEAQTLKDKLHASLEQHQKLSQWLIQNYPDRGYELQGCAVDYLHATGYLAYGWMWLCMMNGLEQELNELLIARKKLACQYFVDHCLPQVDSLAAKIEKGYRTMMIAADEVI